MPLLSLLFLPLLVFSSVTLNEVEVKDPCDGQISPPFILWSHFEIALICSTQ
jgi:hypothetical protein